MKPTKMILVGALILIGSGCDGTVSSSDKSSREPSPPGSAQSSDVVGDGTAIVASISGDHQTNINAKARFRCSRKPGESYIQISSTPRNPMRLEFMFPAGLTEGTYDVAALKMPLIDHTPTYPIILDVKDSEVVLGRRYFTENREGTLTIDALGSTAGSRIAGTFQVTLGSKAWVSNDTEKTEIVRVEGHFDYTTTKDDRCKS